MKKRLGHNSPFCGQQGLTLVELMVAMAISLVLLGGVYQVFFSTTTTYHIQEGLSRLQENGRFAVELMGREIRKAGHPRFDTGGNPFTDSPDFHQGVTGTEGGADSDTITVRFRRQATKPDLSNPNPVIQVVFSVDAANSELEMKMKEGADPFQPTQPLIDGVESMQLLYGEDTDDDDSVDAYVNAAAVTDWGDVVAVRVGLLLASPHEIAKGDIDTATYNVNGTDIDPDNERRLRQVFTTTISLRNQLR